MTRVTGTLHKDRYTFLIISRSLVLSMRNVSDRICTEIKIHTPRICWKYHISFTPFFMYAVSFYEYNWGVKQVLGVI